MSRHIVIDGNAFYEVDDECMKGRKEEVFDKVKKEKVTAEKKTNKEDSEK